jgi:HK97 family phage prohead protease
MNLLTKRDDSTILRLSPTLEIKRASASGAISGYASTFGGEADSYGDVIKAGAFAKSLREHAKAGTAPLMLWCHDITQPIGRWDALTEDASGLLVEGELNLASRAGQEAHALLKHRDVSGLSIGFRTHPGGRTSDGAGNSLLTSVDLLEVSIVPLPANQRARVTSVKSFATRSELVDALREIGLPKAAAKRVAAGGWNALADDGADPDEIDEIKAALRRSAAKWS